MSANSGSLIIVCAVASAVILLVSFFRERLKAFNSKHHIVTYSDALVRPVSWNGGKDGIDIDGIPYYGTCDDDEQDSAVCNVMPLSDKGGAKKGVKEYGDSGKHAA